jgi:L-methionine (R)-S-oxide reductase
MNEANLIPHGAFDKPELYHLVVEAATQLLAEERDAVANAANLAALVYHSLPDLNWLGFYFLKDGELVVGPFQGKPACVRIAIGRGVCGTAAERRETVVVADVNEFPGHIACDGASQSEIVVPLVKGSRLIGVLDADSPVVGRFDAADREGFERLARLWVESIGAGVPARICDASQESGIGS